MADDRVTPQLDDGSRARIAKVLLRWAQAHPRPDNPVLEAADGSQLTPRTIAVFVLTPRSPMGEVIFEMFALAVVDQRRSLGLGEILGVFEADAARWSGRDDDVPPPAGTVSR